MSTDYLGGHKVSDVQINAWVEQFDRDGFVFLPNVLPPELVQELRDDLDTVLGDPAENVDGPRLQKAMFESS